MILATKFGIFSYFPALFDIWWFLISILTWKIFPLFCRTREEVKMCGKIINFTESCNKYLNFIHSLHSVSFIIWNHWSILHTFDFFSKIWAQHCILDLKSFGSLSSCIHYHWQLGNNFDLDDDHHLLMWTH